MSEESPKNTTNKIGRYNESRLSNTFFRLKELLIQENSPEEILTTLNSYANKIGVTVDEIMENYLQQLIQIARENNYRGFRRLLREIKANNRDDYDKVMIAGFCGFCEEKSKTAVIGVQINDVDNGKEINIPFDNIKDLGAPISTAQNLYKTLLPNSEVVVYVKRIDEDED